MSRALRLWGPVAAWMAAIFAAGSFALGPRGATLPPDWLTHGSAYALLALLLSRALAGGMLRPLTRRGAVLAVLVAGAYGVSDEFHQSFVPGRSAELGDVLKDLGGSACGALAFQKLRRDSGGSRV